jgi:hypothetical protein
MQAKMHPAGKEEAEGRRSLTSLLLCIKKSKQEYSKYDFASSLYGCETWSPILKGRVREQGAERNILA